MSKQPEALRLAGHIEKCGRCGGTKPAAAELRRQHALIEEMRQALSSASSWMLDQVLTHGRPMPEQYEQVSAAIAKAEAQQ